MKKRDNQQNLKEAIDRLLKAYNLGDRMLQLDIIEVWEELMGKSIANLTKEMYFKEGILHIELNSSVLREELLMGKSKLIELLNQKLNKNCITDIRFK